MPSQSALDIVNSLFAGQKDLSDYVDTQMKSLAMDTIGDMKKEVGAKMFAPTPDEPEVEASAETEPETPDTPEASTEEPTDETDNGTNWWRQDH